MGGMRIGRVRSCCEGSGYGGGGGRGWGNGGVEEAKMIVALLGVI